MDGLFGNEPTHSGGFGHRGPHFIHGQGGGGQDSTIAKIVHF